MTNLTIVLKFWLSLTNAMSGDCSHVTDIDGSQRIMHWTYPCTPPSLEWCRDPANVAAANAWWSTNDPSLLPASFPTGIDCGANGVIVAGSTNPATGWEVLVDMETQQPIAVLDHASPKRPKSDKKAAADAKSQKLKAIKDKIVAGKTDKQKLDILWEALQASYNVTNSVP